MARVKHSAESAEKIEAGECESADSKARVATTITFLLTSRRMSVGSWCKYCLILLLTSMENCQFYELCWCRSWSKTENKHKGKYKTRDITNWNCMNVASSVLKTNFFDDWLHSGDFCIFSQFEHWLRNVSRIDNNILKSEALAGYSLVLPSSPACAILVWRWLEVILI